MLARLGSSQARVVFPDPGNAILLNGVIQCACRGEKIGAPGFRSAQVEPGGNCYLPVVADGPPPNDPQCQHLRRIVPMIQVKVGNILGRSTFCVTKHSPLAFVQPKNIRSILIKWDHGTIFNAS